VPDTEEFWAQCLREALLGPVAASEIEASSVVLPGGERPGDRADLGGTLEDETQALYLRLAGSAVSLSAEDTDALRVLAEWCIGRSSRTTFRPASPAP